MSFQRKTYTVKIKIYPGYQQQQALPAFYNIFQLTGCVSIIKNRQVRVLLCNSQKAQ